MATEDAVVLVSNLRGVDEPARQFHEDMAAQHPGGVGVDADPVRCRAGSGERTWAESHARLDRQKSTPWVANSAALPAAGASEKVS